MLSKKGPWWVPLASVSAVALLLLALAGGLLLVVRWQGQARFVDSDQVARETGPGSVLELEQPAGQTFVARHGGLAGIELFLLPANQSPLTLTLRLRTGPQSTANLTTSVIQLPPNAAPAFYRFAFTPLESSHGQYYYAFLDTAAPGVSVALAEGGAYLDGAAYQGAEPLDAQTSFRLVYAPGYVALDLLRAALGWIGRLVVAGLLFVVPGWALLAWLWPGRRLVWAEMLGLAVGVSLALYPLLILWTDVVGLHLGVLYAWLPIVGGLAALAWRYRTWRPRSSWETLRQWAHAQVGAPPGDETLWPDLALLIVLALVFGVRFLVIRTLEAPMWGDSYQHSMIVQLLVDNGGLFDSWAPYAELDRFTYHFGFHSAVAVLQWFEELIATCGQVACNWVQCAQQPHTGETTGLATLWAGQLLNGFAVLAIYPLALRVTGSRWGGVWAVLLAGLLSPMPMFFTNWGRYTQLAGLVILPAAVWLTWEAVDMPPASANRRHRWRLVALVALVGGGLALTHYLVLIFYVVFVLALALVSFGRGTWRETLIRLGWAGAGAFLLFVPWFANALGAGFLHLFWQQVTTPVAQTHAVTRAQNVTESLDTYLAPVWWLTMLLGIGVGLWRRQRGVLVVGLWWFLLLIVTNPAWLSLPGTGVITNFTLVISAYLPASLFTASLVAYLFAAPLARPAPGRKWACALMALVVVGLGIWGARQRLGDLDPAGHALVTRPDVRAANWIGENTPPEASFLVNSMPAYGGYAVVGTDGGWWLPLLAARQNTVPPLSYANELAKTSDYRQQVEDFARQVQEHDLDDPAILDLLQRRGVEYIYVGQRQGRVNYPGEDVIHPELLAASENYDLVYHQDRVWVFQVNP